MPYIRPLKSVDKREKRVYNVLNQKQTVEAEKRQKKNFKSEWMAVRVPQRSPA